MFHLNRIYIYRLILAVRNSTRYAVAFTVFFAFAGFASAVVYETYPAFLTPLGTTAKIALTQISFVASASTFLIWGAYCVWRVIVPHPLGNQPRSDINKGILTLLREHLSGEPGSGSIEIVSAPDLDDEIYHYAANNRLARISGILNSRTFRGQPWAGAAAEKIARNTSIVRRNPKTILLVRNSLSMFRKAGDRELLYLSRKRFVGFSMVLPVTDIGFSVYLVQGSVPDNAFSPDLVARADGTVTEPASAIVLFSIALDRGYLKRNDPDFRSNSQVYLKYLTLGVIRQLHDMISTHALNGGARVYIQNSNAKIGKLLVQIGFEKDTRFRTADRETLYSAEVTIR